MKGGLVDDRQQERHMTNKTVSTDSEEIIVTSKFHRSFIHTHINCIIHALTAFSHPILHPISLCTSH